MANIAINSTKTRTQQTATASQTVFPYTFPIKEDADLKVYQRGASDAPNDADDLLTLTTHYTVSGANTASGGNVTLVTGATVGDIITIVGDKTVDRTAIYDQSVTLTKSDLNNDFNDNVMYDKQLATEVDDLVPKYNRSEKIALDVREGNLKLPILNNDEVWIGRGDDGDSPDDITKITLSSTTSPTFMNAGYVLNTNEPLLPNSSNLGALTTGLILNTVTAGTAAFTTATEGTDYYKPGGTDVALADGGTGASTAAAARTNLGLDSMATQAASAVAITGGAIDGVTIGSTTPATRADVDNIRLDGNTISTTDTDGALDVTPDGSGSINLNAAKVGIETDIVHIGNSTNLIAFGTDTQDYQTGGSSRLDVSDSGVRLGGANTRVTTILDEDDLSSDSATALATQQSIKAYVDSGGAHEGSAQFWVRFNAVGTVTIDESFNVTSLTDHAGGDTSINLTTSFAAATYPAAGTAGISSGINPDIMWMYSISAGAVRVRTARPGTPTALTDSDKNCVAGWGAQ